MPAKGSSDCAKEEAVWANAFGGKSPKLVSIKGLRRGRRPRSEQSRGGYWPARRPTDGQARRHPPQDSQAAVDAAIAKFGRIDVLVNNAGNFFAGFFEELSPEQVRQQIETLLFGPMNVTRAVLPVMRKQRSGLLLTISSTAGIIGGVFCTAYATAKFGIEGWIESLAPEIAPFGIRTMLIEPGFFRTELLTTDSTTYAQPSIEDYAERTRETVAAWNSMNGKQGGDPAKLAEALVQLAALEEPPARFAAGADAVQTFEAKARILLAQAGAHRELSSSLAYDRD